MGIGPMHRREFLFSGASTLALGACSRAFTHKQAKNICKGISNPIATRPGNLTIDVHCHLLNAKDVDGAAFLVRRLLDYDERPGKKFAGKNVVKLVNSIFYDALSHVPGAPKEKDRLLSDLRRRGRALLKDPVSAPATLTREQETCSLGLRNHWNFLFGSKIKEFGADGFVSARLKNAVSMMETYRSVNLSIPSMIDFYEGDKLGDPIQEMRFYALLNLATNGRFVPLMSFSPERQFNAQTALGEGPELLGNKTPLERVEIALREWGFLGVKLQTSSGFSPIDNLQYGCLNTRSQHADQRSGVSSGNTLSDKGVYKRFRAYDTIMENLFLTCMRFDAPILTHGKPTLTTNNNCFAHGRRPKNSEEEFRYPPAQGWQPKPSEVEGDYHSTWANSPEVWARAIEHMNQLADQEYRNWLSWHSQQESVPTEMPAGVKQWHSELKGKKLRVCLGHFGGGFRTVGSGLEKKLPDDKAVETIWLKSLRGRSHGRRNFLKDADSLYVDTSEMSELFEPKQKRLLENAAIKLRGITNHGMFPQRTLYGSDWHLPGARTLGKNYLTGMRSVLPRKAMAENAVRFYRLGKKGAARERLSKFYKNPPASLFGTVTREKVRQKMAVNTDDIPWWNASEHVRGT